MNQSHFDFEDRDPVSPVEPMTRWDHYAAAALTGAAANPAGGANSPRDLAHWAASIADSMLKERARRMTANRPLMAAP